MPTALPIHFTLSTTIGTEVWHYRIYSFDPKFLTYYHIKHVLPAHSRYLSDSTTPVALDESLLKDPGKRTDSTDGDITQGNPSFENYELTFFSDPALAPILTALRDLTHELWLEVTIEQPVADCPAPKPGASFWPRKERMFFWGKVLRPQTTGAVDRQPASVSGAEWATKSGVHVGTFKLTFVHWIKVLASARPVSDWLNAVTTTISIPPLWQNVVLGPSSSPPPPLGNPPQPGLVSISSMLFLLVNVLSPTPLYQFDDSRLNAFDGLGDLPQSVGQGNLQAQIVVASATFQTSKLAEIFVPRYIYAYQITANLGGSWVAEYERTDSPLFDSSASPNEMSLYNIKDLSEAIVRLTSEFGFEFHIELPTIAEAEVGDLESPNTLALRTLQWTGCSRWLFPWTGVPVATIYLDPNESSIQYTPASNWISSATYSEPTPQSSLFGPANATADLGLDPEKSNPFSGKTLFRFAAFNTDSRGLITLSFVGVELYVGPDMTTATPAHSALTSSDKKTAFEAPDWAYLHAIFMMLRWGRPLATVEFDNYSRALEPFGASNAKAQKPRRTFGVNDIGDFPRARSFAMDPGMMHADAKPATTRGGEFTGLTNFSCYEVTFTPGSPTHILGIEIGTLSSSGTPIPTDTSKITEVVGPPAGPPAPPTSPGTPTILSPTGGPVSGSVSIVTQVVPSSPTVPTASVKLLVNTIFTDILTVANGSGGTYLFTWNAALVSHGTYVLEVISTGADGLANSASVSVTV